MNSIKRNYKTGKCASCMKTFFDGKSLKRHIYNVHEGHKDYKCESCGKSFAEASNLKRHIHTVHEGRKDHKCESCGKSFTEGGKLKKHINSVHEGHKNASTFLKQHIHTVHESYKDHKIIQVAKIIKDEEGVSGQGNSKMVQNHNCHFCGKSFFHPELLGIHNQTFHEEAWTDWKCNSCDDLFASAILLKEHIHTVHSCQNENQKCTM